VAVSRAWLAGPDEAEAVAGLLVQFRNHLGRDWPSDNAFLAIVERLMEDASTEYLLAAADDDSPPAGVCQLRYRFGIWLAGVDCWLEDLYVSESARGAGLGAALVELALERARARDAKRIQLDVSDANAPALALYRRFGFTTGKDPGTTDLFMARKL
jgi:ribosomal protein S18 acetylase RimI-like enzyme